MMSLRALSFLSTMAILTPLVFSQASAAPNDYKDDYDLVDLKVLVHIENYGDQHYGEYEWAGTKGKSLRLEGFSVNFGYDKPKGVKLEYYCHIQNEGDRPKNAEYKPKGKWLKEGEFCGTRGYSLRVEGFAIRLYGRKAKNYDVYYECHIQDKGDVGPKSNGKFCGTKGLSKRLEAMKVWVVKDY